MKPLLSVIDLKVQCQTKNGPVQIVNSIGFHINPGEIVGLVGESGSGKSMTALALLNLLGKNTSIQGQVLFEDKNLLDLDEKLMRTVRGKHIGMVFQDPTTSLDPTMCIGQQVAETILEHQNLSKKQAYEKSVSLLSQVGIGEPQKRMEQYPHELSGGMRQRVMIAIALSCDPQLLIADEPTTALDLTIQSQILELIKLRQREKGFSVLWITHDLGVVANMCQRVLVMHNGKIVEDASVVDLFSNPKHPYTQTLLKSSQWT